MRLSTVKFAIMILLNSFVSLRQSRVVRQLLASRHVSHCKCATNPDSTHQDVSSGTGGGRRSAAVVASSASSKATDDSLLTKLDLNPPKGTRDFYPEEKRISNWLFDHFKRVAKVYGFEEYDAPVLEKEILYIRKSGDEVMSQLYNFVDKGENRVSLRPEMTPSLARMVLSKKNGLSFPLKWFSIPQCWRYERMTRGRRREHYQWNMDIWGVPGVEAEAEILSAIVTCFKNLGLSKDDVGIRINSRKILEDIMSKLGVPESLWASACVLVDKLDKQPSEAILTELTSLGVAADNASQLIDTILKKEMNAVTELLGESSEGVRDIKRLMALATAYGIEDWLVFDASVVRGLSYYTGVVFEGFDRSGQLRAICGGGRYDKLVETMSAGETSVTAVGFGFGDAVIMELLKMKNLVPDMSLNKVDILVYFLVNKDGPNDASADPLQLKAISAASRLRQAGWVTDVVLEDKKVKWAFQRADKIGADFVVMYAGDEATNNEVVVKDMRQGTQTVVRDELLIATIANMLPQK